ncbi:DinB family protein [Mucilaginibacter jinjuensis]|uniref:DinB family protein n=1 Tax=Mucilaginibacter jinjuensis TaxID=1176721 RepID=A0ABY7T4S0_9SPHI|nr:DinB family protein [Mucilaginibacter jinjuensis]WCT11459.1 DinB family protein [Mucilaginibacter jinjuensis]
MIKIGRPNLNDAPSWYKYFFDLAQGDDLIEALEKNKQDTLDLIASIPFNLEDHSYAEGKWNIKQVFIHLCDEERYYAYKAFCLSRQTNVLLEIPMSENYTKNFNVSGRSLKDIAWEFITVRNATISLLSTMNLEMLDFKFPDENPYTARSLGWFAVGHNEHHSRLVRERYL